MKVQNFVHIMCWLVLIVGVLWDLIFIAAVYCDSKEQKMKMNRYGRYEETKWKWRWFFIPCALWVMALVYLLA